MPLVARASNTVRNKNLLILLLCLGFLVLFAYDGFVGYPRTNDVAVARWKTMLEQGSLRPVEAQLDTWKAGLDKWPGWNGASRDERRQMHEVHEVAKGIKDGEVKWYSPFDVSLQRYIAYGLALAVAGAVWWVIHCQKRRAIADDSTVSPADGITIPWDHITIVDNTRWKRSGIVEITYLGDAGQAQKAKFDDYELDREPLLEILDLLAEKAQKAEFIPKEET